MASRPRRPPPPPEPAAPPGLGIDEHTSSPVPLAMPGPRTPRERALALTMAASMLVAASSLGMGRSPTAPDCAPTRSGEVSWADPDGCWEKGSDNSRRYRTTTSTGVRSYYSSPPQGSRYYGSGSRWSFWSSRSSSSTSSSYRGSGSSGG